MVWAVSFRPFRGAEQFRRALTCHGSLSSTWKVTWPITGKKVGISMGFLGLHSPKSGI